LEADVCRFVGKCRDEIGVSFEKLRGLHGAARLRARQALISNCPKRLPTSLWKLKRRSGNGPSHDNDDCASQPRIQGVHVVNGVPPARAAGRSFQTRHQRMPAFTRIGGARQICVDERRNVDTDNCAAMVPEIEARIDFQEPEIALEVALEVELGDAGQRQPLNDLAARAADIACVGYRQRSSM